MSILWNRVIKRGAAPFGCAAQRKHVAVESQRVVCFSETPLGFLERIVKRRGSSYGVGFHKRVVMQMGGAPLWYVELGSPQQRALSRLITAALKARDHHHPVWELTPFIDFTSGKSRPYSYDFRWEREWRVRADVAFRENDVAFLFIPEHQHELAWGFFESARNDNVGPGYFCPYIDPLWSVDKVREALEAAKKRVPPPLQPRW